MRLRPALGELLTVAVIVALCGALVLAWRYLLGAGFLVGAWRLARTGRVAGDATAVARRNSSRFAEIVQALAFAHASWQTRRIGRS